MFFKINEFFFALNTFLVKKVEILNESQQLYIQDPDKTDNYEIFDGLNFLKIKKGIENPKKNLLIINSKKGYQYGIAVDEVEGFFRVEDTKLINKASLLNRYGYEFIDFAVNINNKLIFVFYDEFFDERYRELTCLN